MKIFLLLVGVILLSGGTFATLGENLQLTALLSLSDSSQNEEKCFELLQTSYPEISVEDLHFEKIDLTGNSNDDLLVRIENTNYCGTAGCVHELCYLNSENKLVQGNFGFAANSVKVLEVLNHGLKNIELNGDSSMRLEWNSKRYQLVQ